MGPTPDSVSESIEILQTLYNLLETQVDLTGCHTHVRNGLWDTTISVRKGTAWVTEVGYDHYTRRVFLVKRVFEDERA